jgi:hypothetical protein
MSLEFVQEPNGASRRHRWHVSDDPTRIDLLALERDENLVDDGIPDGEERPERGKAGEPSSRNFGFGSAGEGGRRTDSEVTPDTSWGFVSTNVSVTTGCFHRRSSRTERAHITSVDSNAANSKKSPERELGITADAAVTNLNDQQEETTSGGARLSSEVPGQPVAGNRAFLATEHQHERTFHVSESERISEPLHTTFRNPSVSDIAETDSLVTGPSMQTMGYPGNIDTTTFSTSIASAWSVPEASSDKMESAAQHAEPERAFSLSAHRIRDTDDDDTTIRSLDSAADGNFLVTPLYGDTMPESHFSTHTSVVGTPSTTSTAPLTDEASWSMEASALSNVFTDANLGLASGGGPASYHRRVPSWEGLTQQVQSSIVQSDQYQGLQQQGYSGQLAQGAWGTARGAPQATQQQRVASFRGDHQGYPPMAPPGSNRWQHNYQQQRFSETHVPFLSQGGNRSYLPAHQAPYHHYQMPEQRPAHYAAQPHASSLTPPRSRGQRLAPVHAAHSPHRPALALGGVVAAGARSSSEILKTLLRKKACLYEPDTSRAVTLITWLVGRHLALENGFFSRQQLQAGVHSCIANKIDSGVITRTKVNRCMQIILNSCFHYIIPRPDGTEESGSSFRKIFAEEVSDDEFLLKVLHAPWNDVAVDRATILKASLHEDMRHGKVEGQSPMKTPQSSPRFASANAHDTGSPGGDSNEDDKDESKRAVLLCFNENVRCAEDVLRCHNEFIRDTAHASSLQLSSQEWRQFFGEEAAAAPHIWGNIGIPITHQEGKDSTQTDALGVMTIKEAAFFRTSWCAKRYDHNHELCGFAHSEVSGGWLRRSPNLHEYEDEMCPSVSKLSYDRSDSKVLVLNECPHGVECKLAHSAEEILYHPRRYKGKQCLSAARPGGCKLGDVCSHFHLLESYRFPKKSDVRSPRHGRLSQQLGANKGVAPCPSGAPILYASPAPISAFDQQLATPGLKNLYRRHCALARALVRAEHQQCYYSYFGDDAGLTGNNQERAGTNDAIIGPHLPLAPPSLHQR